MPSTLAAPTAEHSDVGRSWLQAITALDDGALATLLSRRPDLLSAGPSNLAELAQVVMSPASVRAFLAMADQASRQALEALCVLGVPTTSAAVAATLGTESHLVEPVLAGLAESGLVLGGSERLVRNPALPAAIPHPGGLGPPAQATLAAQPAKALTDMARRLGVDAQGPKPAIVAAVVGALSSPERMAAMAAAGPDGTVAMARRLAQEYLQVRLAYGSYYPESRTDRTPEGWLLRRGMLVTESWGLATMPAEVAIALRGGQLFDTFSPHAPPLASTPVGPGGVDDHAAQIGLAVVADIAAVLDAWGADPPKLLQSGGLGVREVRRVAKATGRSEADAARLVELAAFAGLVDDDGAVALPTRHYDRWLDAPAAARWVELADAWRRAPAHLSLAGATDTRDKMIPALLDRPPERHALSRRTLVLGLVTQLPGGCSAEAASVAGRARWLTPAVWEGGPARPDRLVTWVLEEAELLGITVGQCPSSFGRALAEGDPDAAGAALGALSPPLTTEVVLQADLTAVASGELAPDLRRQLDLLADVESTGAATVYRFSESSLRRGFDAGRTSAEILTVLAEHAPKGVPQALAYLVEDLGRRHGRVRVGSATCYVRCDDAALLAEVVRARKTSRLHLRSLAPTVAVADIEPATLVAVLRQAGYLAAPEGPDGSLVLAAPPARRTRGPDPGDGHDGPADDEIELTDELLAALTGIPPAALSAITADQRRRLVTGDPPEVDGVEQDDVTTVVQRLRSAPAPPAPRSAAPPTRRSPRPPIAHLSVLEDDDPPRPGHIAREPGAIAELLATALDEGWLVRLCYLNSKGHESEDYVEPLALGPHAVNVLRLGRGGSHDLAVRRIRWARIVTETEEEALW
jgi:DNA-binding IscR family transcriptional regulator